MSDAASEFTRLMAAHRDATRPSLPHELRKLMEHFTPAEIITTVIEMASNDASTAKAASARKQKILADARAALSQGGSQS